MVVNARSKNARPGEIYYTSSVEQTGGGASGGGRAEACEYFHRPHPSLHLCLPATILIPERRQLPERRRASSRRPSTSRATDDIVRARPPGAVVVVYSALRVRYVLLDHCGGSGKQPMTISQQIRFPVSLVIPQRSDDKDHNS